MKKFYNIKLLMLVCLLVSFGVLTSCEDDNDDINTNEVQLLSFGPTGVQHGEEIRFIGRNLNRVDAIELPGATVPKSEFVTHSAELITLVVPNEAAEGRVVLKTASGDITSKSILSFEVPVTITSVTEEARPGSNITIRGNFMNWVTGVNFADNILVEEFVSQSLTELVVEVPLAAQTGRLTLYTGGTEPLVINTEEDLIVTLPSVTDLAPNPVERGAELTITGENLDLTEGILFRGIQDPVTTFVSKSESEIVVVVPEDASRGIVTLVAYSGVEVESEMAMELEGDLPPLAPLAHFLFDDARGSGWDNWGWGGPSVWDSQDRVRQGDFAAKKTYDGSYDAIRWHNNTPVSMANYDEFVFSVFGDAGTGGRNMQLVINEVWGSPYVFPIVEGEWTTYRIPLSQLGSPASIGDVLFQSAGWAGTVHYDHVGFD